MGMHPLQRTPIDQPLGQAHGIGQEPPSSPQSTGELLSNGSSKTCGLASPSTRLSGVVTTAVCDEPAILGATGRLYQFRRLFARRKQAHRPWQFPRIQHPVRGRRGRRGRRGHGFTDAVPTSSLAASACALSSKTFVIDTKPGSVAKGRVWSASNPRPTAARHRGARPAIRPGPTLPMS